MAITLGTITFDPAYTTVHEGHEDVGGRDARHIEIAGLIAGEHSVEDVEARLDAILAAASSEGYTGDLSLRSGRRLWVQRAKYSRDVLRDRLTGSFVLALDAKDPFEESTTVRTVSWTIAASDATKVVAGAGNVFALPTITFTASGTVVNPSFSDGVRTLAYAGVVAHGAVLVLNAAAGTVTLNGVDVTCYTTGEFPRIEPAGATLSYADDPTSSHAGVAAIVVRDRWW